MAKINDGTLRDWKNGDIVSSDAYEQDREILRVAINDTDDKVEQAKTDISNHGTRLDDLEYDVTGTVVPITFKELGMQNLTFDDIKLGYIENKFNQLIENGTISYPSQDSVNKKIIDIWLNVIEDFGATGDGTTDDKTALQSAFNYAQTNGSVKLYFPKGTYCLSGYVKVYKNTTIELHPEAIIKRIGTTTKLFVNGALGGSDYVVNGGYTGEGNIHWKGGTIDFNHRDSAGIATTDGIGFFDLGHAENISFTDIKFVDGRAGHFWQVSSCRNVRFKNLDIQPSTYVDTSTTNHECIQIEVATKLSFPSFGKYDNTPCKDIFIENCTFDSQVRCIGTHSFVNTQTTTGSITAGSNQLTVADATKFNVGETIYVEDAGTNNYLDTTISSKAGNVLTLAANATTTVTNTKVANQTDRDIASVFCENIVIKNCVFKNTVSNPLRLMAYKYVRVENNTTDTPQSDGIYLSQVEDSIFNGNLIMNTIKTGIYMSVSHRNKFSNNILREIATGGGYSAIRLLTCNYNTFTGTTVTSITPAYNFAFYTSDGCLGNKIPNHNFTIGTGGKIGGADDTEYSNIVIGNGQDILFDGDLAAVNDTGTLAHDIRNYSMLIIVGNDNGSATASLTCVTLPKSILTIGSTVGRFRFIPDDSSASDRTEFSFPTSKSLRVDTVSGTSHIRKVIGVL